MFTALAARIAAAPKRTLVLSLLFVVIAAAVGGPVVGSLENSGGFTPEDAGSVQALAAIQSATGAQATPRVVALLRTPVRRRLAARRSAGSRPCSARWPPIPRWRRSRR